MKINKCKVCIVAYEHGHYEDGRLLEETNVENLKNEYNEFIERFNCCPNCGYDINWEKLDKLIAEYKSERSSLPSEVLKFNEGFFPNLENLLITARKIDETLEFEKISN